MPGECKVVVPVFLSDGGPSPHHSRFSSPSPRTEHLPDVQAATEPDEVVAAPQIVLPTSHASIVAGVVIVFQRGREFPVISAIALGMLHHRFLAGHARRRVRGGRPRYETVWVGPIWRNSRTSLASRQS